MSKYLKITSTCNIPLQLTKLIYVYVREFSNQPKHVIDINAILCSFDLDQRSKVESLLLLIKGYVFVCKTTLLVEYVKTTT